MSAREKNPVDVGAASRPTCCCRISALYRLEWFLADLVTTHCTFLFGPRQHLKLSLRAISHGAPSSRIAHVFYSIFIQILAMFLRCFSWVRVIARLCPRTFKMIPQQHPCICVGAAKTSLDWSLVLSNPSLGFNWMFSLGSSSFSCPFSKLESLLVKS